MESIKFGSYVSDERKPAPTGKNLTVGVFFDATGNNRKR